MRSAIALVLILFTSTSQSANIWCVGSITNFYITAGGSVQIRGSWRNEYTEVCNFNEDSYITPVVCSLWVSIINSSVANNKSVRLMYDDNNGAINCESIPTYSKAPIPQYVMLNN